jgi:hypothetical protein
MVLVVETYNVCHAMGFYGLHYYYIVKDSYRYSDGLYFAV